MLYVGALLGHDHAADYDRAAIRDQHFRIRFLGVNGRDALNARDRGVNRVVLHVHVHVNRAIRGDLRDDVEFQHRIHELDRNGVVHDGLHRDLGALLDDRLLVVLRDDLRLRDQLADAALFRGGDDLVDRKVRVLEDVARTAGRCCRAQVRQ